MNKFLKQLVNASGAESRLVIGLMSGTSLDGLDVALCRIQGFGLSTKVKVLHFNTFLYPEDFKDDIRTIFSKWQVELEKVTLLNARIGDVHANLILEALHYWKIEPCEIDFIASHGQTIYHAPKRLHQKTSYPNATLQIGDGDHIAVKTGIITLSDFRQKDVAAGGEGAPLALYGDYILFSSTSENRILLNIGGISNFTYLPSNQSKIVCSDAGPGNTLIDQIAQNYFNLPFDDKGKIAAGGKVSEGLLSELLSHPFFSERTPKTTGPELFNMNYLKGTMLKSETAMLSAEDLMATVTQFTAEAIAGALRQVVQDDRAILYVSGGGSHNDSLLQRLGNLLEGVRIEKFETFGMSADAKEAALFAVLANETVCGSIVETGAGPAVMMGKISLPE